MKQKAIVIGAGFSGLSSAAYLAKAGYQVTILEKHNSPGGRARKFSEAGFTFDMGPSWYWMPDVFDSFFNDFGKNVSDFYELERLDPSYRIYFGEEEYVDLSASMPKLVDWFESQEVGAGEKLKNFLKDAQYKYEIGIQELVKKPGQSLLEFADIRVVKGLFQLNLFSSIKSFIRKSFSNPKLIEILEFPILFLGAMPKNTPALYSLMNYADMSLGTWFPKGGMHEIVTAMVSVCSELGVEFAFNQDVQSFEYESNEVKSVVTDSDTFYADVVVASADYHHIDKKVLDPKYSNYSDKYWDKRKMAPSSLLYYVGLDKKLEGALHHNLFFDADFEMHAKSLYETESWPEDPLFYLSVTSKTDPTTAPEKGENLFILIPSAPGLKDSQEIKDHYFNLVIKRIEKHFKTSIAESIVYRKDFAYSEFISEYNSFKGNAYGLANTLDQTAILKPSIKNKKLHNLYFTGQLTTPGPGVPPSLISGQVVANQIIKEHRSIYESIV